MKRLVLIDGHAIIHRAYHALPPMTVTDGTIVNAVYGFTSMLLKVIDDLQPTHIAVCFDVAGGTFRDEIFEEYKATRQKADQDLYDQIPLVYQMVEAFGISIFEQQGFEADDIIGTIAQDKKVRKAVDEIFIVTGDKDLLQLVDEKVTAYLLRKGMSETSQMHPADVTKMFGFGPEHVIDYKAFRGDTSDNIPGIKGIGDKTATALITQFGGLEDIYTELEQVALLEKKEQKERLKEVGLGPAALKKILEGRDSAEMSRELATIKTDVPAVDFDLKDADIATMTLDEAASELKKFEFYSLVPRLPGYKKKAADVEPEEVVEVQTVATQKDADAFVAKAKTAGVIVFHPSIGSGDGVVPEVQSLVCAVGGDVVTIDKSQIDAVLSLCEVEKVAIVGHDIKPLVKVFLSQEKKLTATIFDTMIASYLVHASTRSHDLPAVVQRELGQELQEEKQESLFGSGSERLAQEAQAIASLYESFSKKLKELKEEELFFDIEMGVLPVLAVMEMHGIALDTAMLGEMSTTLRTTLDELTKKIHVEAGTEFNVASSVQLRDVLFETMGLPTQGIKKGKTGYSTAASELEKLREYSPIIEMIEEYRELEKLRNTYVDVLPSLINKKTKRIHTSFNQAVAATGRLSSSDPNLQNIPIRTEMGREIRKAFVADKGKKLIAADYSQIELRVAAHLAQDKTMIEVFQNGDDIHTATAAAINDVPIEEVTKEMRRSAKEVNFGVLYGMGAFGLASRTKLPQWQAKDFIDKYFERFDGVRRFLDETLEQAGKKGYVETLFGRRRDVPELTSSNYQVRNAGERMAINMPIQGTAADIMKKAMIAVQEKYANDPDVLLLLQVHDELVLEVVDEKIDVVTEDVKEMMESVATLDVPIVVDVHVGKNWGEMK